MIEPIVIPSVGATGGDIVIQEWLVAVGDSVEQGQTLLIAETDKANIELESFRSGVIRKLLFEDGDTVGIGEPVAMIADTSDEPLGSASDRPTDKNVIASADSHRDIDRKDLYKFAAILGSNGEPGREQWLAMYRRMVLIRRFEDHLYGLFLQGKVPGTLHQCQGQEAVAVGVCAALRHDDVIFSTHRPVGHLLAKGCTARSIAAEIWGKATGCAGGKGGQMHLVDASVGAMPSNAIVGANIPIATGAAIGFKLRGMDNVAVSFFGDGASNIGPFHEGINFAAARDAPVVFVCENNLYGASTHHSLVSRITDIADRAAAYGIPGVVADGMNVNDVYHTAKVAVDRARKGEGPTLIECKTYRYAGHSRGDPGQYRGEGEMEYWRNRDPIPQCRAMLTKQFAMDDNALNSIDADCQREIEDAVEFAVNSPDPDAQSVFEHVFA